MLNLLDHVLAEVTAKYIANQNIIEMTWEKDNSNKD